MTIHFKKAKMQHQKILFNWLDEPHVKEFWDNSQAHRNDILNFLNGRSEPSSYAEGRYVYWIGFFTNIPYSLIMTIKENPGEDRPSIKEQYLSQTGSTYSLDYMIGNKEFLGKRLGAKTLQEFTLFFQKYIDPLADTFFIDPDQANPRAKHVYVKAGFQEVGNFIIDGDSVFKGRLTDFLVKKLPLIKEEKIDRA